MKTLLLVAAGLMLAATPAFACRGTVEYPQTAAQLANLDVPEAQKQEYMKQFERGEALHHRGHELDDADIRREALKILDEIKAKIAM